MLNQKIKTSLFDVKNIDNNIILNTKREKKRFILYKYNPSVGI